MSQCVPNWDLDDGLPNPSTANTTTANIHAPTSDYVVSELTWEKVHASKDGFHGSPPARRAGKLPQKRPPAGGDPSWEKHHASGTLEAVVDQACTRALVPAAADALVPSAKLHDQLEHLPPARVVPDVVAGVGTLAAAAAAVAASGCGGRKRARAGAAGDGYSRSATGSAASAGFTFDSCDINGDCGEETGFATSTSPLDGSTPETEHASCGRALPAVSEEDDSYYHSRRPLQKYVSDEEEKNEKERSTTMPIRRIRVAAVHNQSERKRRDRINQRMRTLQKLVPNSSKCDKASILDEVIDYMRQLQAQVQMMSRMSSMSPMMMPMAAMQQMQMAVMAQMAQMAQMGMAMGMGMPDMGQPGMPSWAAAAAAAGFLPPAALPRDIRDYPTQQASAGVGAGAFPPDPFAAYMAFQTQQMAVDARGRMAAGLCERPHQQPAPGSAKENQSGGDVL